ncbi:MAG: sigma-70 family RNA polymerase sigma factor, partial [Planctomycetota bacterium]|nr:sigma-70 family RNA polymerase sigma factor [Planctomycetota bacterium]
MSPADPASAIREHLDQHVESVRRLAQSLVGDPNAADDLAQDAWVAALTSPPPTGRPIRAWLGRVVRNAARSLGRRETIRAGHERDAGARDGLPSTPEMLERVSVQRSVVDSVLALDEPYRRAILLRYFEGLTPSEIARKRGVPAATVKTQLRRALALLRERLDRDHGDRRTWLLALTPLAKSGGAMAAAGTGALIVSTKTAVGAVAAAAAILVGGVWWANRAMDPETPEVAVATPDMTGSEPIAPLVDPPVEAVSATAVRKEAESSTTGSVSAITLDVVEAASGDPLSGVEVWYGPGSVYMDVLRARLTLENPDLEQVARKKGEMRVSDASGRVTIPKDTEDDWVLAVARHGELFGMNQVVFARENTHRLELVPDSSITIEVVDGEGNPAPGVPVGVRISENRREELLWSARTGADGTAAMRHFETFAGQYVAQGLTPYAVLPFPLATPVEVELAPADLPELARLTVPPTGRVVVHLLDEAGEPVTGDKWGRLVSIESHVDDVLAPGRTKRIGTHDLR